MELGLNRRDLLALLVASYEVDVKFSLSGGWMIPPEAVDQVCLPTNYREGDRTVSAGLLRTTDDVPKKKPEP